MKISYSGKESKLLLFLGVIALISVLVFSSAGNAFGGVDTAGIHSENAGSVSAVNAVNILRSTDDFYKSSSLQNTVGISNYTLLLGSVNSSYLQNVSVPVYVDEGRNFTGLVQVFSYDPNLLKFTGILNDVSSQNVTFTYVNVTDGMLKVFGNGTFVVLPYKTTLFYLSFSPVNMEQITTEVVLDYSIIGSSFNNVTSSSSVTLVRGWTNLGPSNIIFTFTGNESRYTGLGAGFTYVVGFSPYNMSTIYAGSGGPVEWGWGGLMKSTDGGIQWEQVDLGLNYTRIVSIWVDPLNPNTVVLVSDGGGDAGGIFKTVNGGLSWQEVYPGSADNLQFVSGRGLYAFTINSVLLSSNLGTNWNVVSARSSPIYYGMVVDNGSGIVLAEANKTRTGMMIFVSNNGGTTYTSGGESFDYPFNINLISDPSNSSIQWMNDMTEYANDSLFKSVDGGLNWKSITFQSIGIAPFDLDSCPQVITYDPSNSSIMYLGGETYVAKSTDGGATFQDLHNFSTSPYAIVVDPLNDSTVFVGGEHGLFVSHNGGLSWLSLNNRSTTIATGISVDGNNDLVALEQYGPYVSNDSGKSWYPSAPRPVGPDGTNLRWEGGATTVDPYNNSIVIYAAGGMVVSHNGGLTYTIPQINNSGVDNQNISGANAFAFIPNSSVMFYAGGGRIYESSDNGYNWSIIPNSPIYCSAIAGTMVNGTFELYASNNSGLFISDNEGINWTKISDYYLKSIAIDPENSSIIAATDMTEAVISHDSGISFAYANISSQWVYVSWWYPKVMYQELGNGSNILYFVSTKGVYASFDNGIKWKNVSYNIPSLNVISVNIYGNTTYITTQGSGVLYDPSLFNLTLYENKPILSGYVPKGFNATVDGTSIIGSGFFSIQVNLGVNSIFYGGKEVNLTASNGNVYFINFSNMKVHLTITGENLPAGTEWNISANGNIYAINGTSTIILPPFTSGIYVYPFATEYSIYYPSKTFYPINSSLFPSISINFTQKEETSNSNITSKVSGIMWDAGSVYNNGYILYYGQGLGLYDVKDGSFVPINSQIRGYFRSAVSFGSGFVLGGSNDGSEGILGFYNLTDMSLENMTGMMPQTWQHMPSGAITSVTASSSSIYIALAASGHNYLGEISGTRFTNLTSYIHPYQYNSGEHGLAIDYIGTLDAIAFSTYWNQGFLGLLYLSSSTALNLTAMLPRGIEIGNVMSTSSAVLSPGPSSFDIIATGRNGTGYVGIFNYSGESLLHTSLWLPYFSPSSTEWDGHDYIVSGQWSNDDSYVVVISSGGTVSYIPSGAQGLGPMMDSATGINYSRFAIVYYYNGSYFDDYYSMVSANPVSTVRGFVSPNNGSLYIDGIQVGITNSEYSFPVFSGNTTISYYSPGYAADSRQIYSPPFSTTWENISLNTATSKLYQIIFIESGLSSGTPWSVTLNGTTESSTTNDIIFSEPNGNYPYSLSIPQGYTASNSSGTIILNGRNITQTVTFVSIPAATYTVIFTESGLPSGTLWSVTLNGTMKSSNTNTITFTEPYGTYSFSVTLPSGYKTTSSSGEVKTTQSSTNVDINVSPVSKTTTPPATTNYLLIGVIVAIVVIIALVGAVIAMRRSRNKGRKPDKLQEPPSQLPPKG